MFIFILPNESTNIVYSKWNHLMLCDNDNRKYFPSAIKSFEARCQKAAHFIQVCSDIQFALPAPVWYKIFS